MEIPRLVVTRLELPRVRRSVCDDNLSGKSIKAVLLFMYLGGRVLSATGVCLPCDAATCCPEPIEGALPPSRKARQPNPIAHSLLFFYGVF